MPENRRPTSGDLGSGPRHWHNPPLPNSPDAGHRFGAPKPLEKARRGPACSSRAPTEPHRAPDRDRKPSRAPPERLRLPTGSMHRLKNGHPAHVFTDDDRRKAAAVTNQIRRERAEILELGLENQALERLTRTHDCAVPGCKGEAESRAGFAATARASRESGRRRAPGTPASSRRPRSRSSGSRGSSTPSSPLGMPKPFGPASS
jgi:hypothetical protein